MGDTKLMDFGFDLEGNIFYMEAAPGEGPSIDEDINDPFDVSASSHPIDE